MREKIFEVIVTENFVILMSDFNPQIQEAQRTLNNNKNKNEKKTKNPKQMKRKLHLGILLWNYRNFSKLFKEARENTLLKEKSCKQENSVMKYVICCENKPPT